MAQRRISMSDIQVGQQLPWNVYDSSGLLLLKKGYFVEHPTQVEALVERGLFVETASSPTRGPDEASREKETPSVLRLVNLANKKLEKLLFGLNHEPEFPEKLLEVAKAVVFAADLNPDIALACILLNQQPGGYPIQHSIDTAIISILIARSMKVAPEEVLTLTAAALSMNVGMIHYQAQLQRKQGALSAEEIERIHQHPQEGVKMLESAGVRDPDWLACVLAHHENEDGSGYPFGKKGNDIPRNAKLISLADRYCARISARDFRKPAFPKVVLRDIFLESGKSVDPTLAGHFIKELGIYPPGALVRLNNGETGVVTKKGGSATTPVVHALVGPRGVALSIPVKRDTAGEQFAIKETLSEEEADVRFSMHQVWGDAAKL